MVVKRYLDFINETLMVSLSFREVVECLAKKNNNKVAELLSMLIYNDFYDDDENINYVGLDKEVNMFSYLPKRRRTTNYDDNMYSDLRVAIRVGRGVKQIVDKVLPMVNFKGDFNITIQKYIRGATNRDTENFILFLDKETQLLFKHNNILKIKTTIGDEEVNIEGCINSRYSYHDGHSAYLFTVDDQTDSYKILNKNTTSASNDHPTPDEPATIELTNDIKITAADIEAFANEYVSFIRQNKGEGEIEEVKSWHIRKWYDSVNYKSRIGKLGNSCMSGEDCQEFFDIYTANTEVVSLLILKRDNALVGRALLWKLDNGEMFMDRIYTSFDSDDNIFINYAIKNGYMYRNTSTSNPKYYKDGKEVPIEKLTIKLYNYDFDYYPYMDTFMFLNMKNGILSNQRVGEDIYDANIRTLHSTDGKWNEYEDDEDDY